jgi:hypothetical protein
MKRAEIETMSKVAGLLARVKDMCSSSEAREQLALCQKIMADHCGTSPIKLIAGKVDEIMNEEVKHEFKVTMRVPGSVGRDVAKEALEWMIDGNGYARGRAAEDSDEWPELKVAGEASVTVD